MEASDTELLAATQRVLAEHGLAGFTAERVASAAGVSRVTLHRHGIRRRELLQAVVAQAAQDMRSSLTAVVTDRGGADARLERALHELCRVVERHRAVLAALFVAQDPGRASGVDFVEPFERLAVDAGVPPEAARDRAQLAVNAATWTYLHMRVAHGWSQRRAREAVVAMALATLLAR